MDGDQYKSKLSSVLFYGLKVNFSGPTALDVQRLSLFGYKICMFQKIVVQLATTTCRFETWIELPHAPVTTNCETLYM